MNMKVTRGVWVRHERPGFYDSYKLIYEYHSKHPHKNIYYFKLIEAIKLNKEPFTGGGDVYILNRCPDIGHTISLRRRKPSWYNKNGIKFGIYWFNVKLESYSHYNHINYLEI